MEDSCVALHLPIAHSIKSPFKSLLHEFAADRFIVDFVIARLKNKVVSVVQELGVKAHPRSFHFSKIWANSHNIWTKKLPHL